MRKLLYIFLCLALPLALFAAEIDFTMQLSVSPSQCTIGDPVEIIQSVTTEEQMRLRWQELPEKIENFMIIDSFLEQIEAETGAVISQRIIKVVPFATGELIFPATAFELIDSEGVAINGNFPAARLSVLSVAPGSDPLAVAELKDIMEPPVKKSWLWLYITIAAVVLLALVIFLLWRRKHMPKRLKDLIKVTPAERAMQELLLLEKEELINQGDFEAHFTRASFTIRQYLAMRYHFAALEKTSTELKYSFAKIWPEKEEMKELLDEMLQTSDLVKFAKYSPDQAEGENSIAYSRGIINHTRDDLVKPIEEA
jgi:hypothetical protein